ncbi:hypothetical protein PCE1_002793 [Barthelona sp. PCE]
MSRNTDRARNITNITRKSPNYASKCTFKHVHILLSPYDVGAWKVTRHSSIGGTSIDTQLDNNLSSLINVTNPEKILMSCGGTYGAMGIVRDGLCETHFVTFRYNNDGIKILNRVVVPEVYTHMSVHGRDLGIIGANQNVITTYLVLNDGSLVNRTEHHLPFPITSFYLCPNNWVIATKHLHLNESIIWLYNIDSGERTILPHIVTELDISISATNSYSFNACNVTMRDEIIFVTLSFPNNEIYTMSISNDDQKYEITDDLKMNSIAKDHVSVEPSAGRSVSVCDDLKPRIKPIKQKQPDESLILSSAAAAHVLLLSTEIEQAEKVNYSLLDTPDDRFDTLKTNSLGINMRNDDSYRDTILCFDECFNDCNCDCDLDCDLDCDCDCDPECCMLLCGCCCVE